MKSSNFFLLIAMLFLTQIFSQEANLHCDTIFLSNNSQIVGKIQRIEKQHVQYFLCCDNCLVLRRINRNEISKISYSNLDSKRQIKIHNPNLLLVKNGRENRTKKIKQNTKIVVEYNNGAKLKGEFHIIDFDSIQIRNKAISFNDINRISKPLLFPKIIGNTIGIGFFAIGIRLIIEFPFYEGLGYSMIPNAFSLPFFSMNFIKKSYNTSKKWSLKIKLE